MGALRMSARAYAVVTSARRSCSPSSLLACHLCAHTSRRAWSSFAATSWPVTANWCSSLAPGLRILTSSWHAGSMLSRIPNAKGSLSLSLPAHRASHRFTCSSASPRAGNQLNSSPVVQERSSWTSSICDSASLWASAIRATLGEIRLGVPQILGESCEAEVVRALRGGLNQCSAQRPAAQLRGCIWSFFSDPSDSLLV